MTDIKPVEAWAVVGPDGAITTYISLIGETDAWLRMCSWYDIKRAKEIGYTIQPIIITGRKE